MNKNYAVVDTFIEGEPSTDICFDCRKPFNNWQYSECPYCAGYENFTEIENDYK